MKINKFKSLSVSVCCLVTALWSESKCAEQIRNDEEKSIYNRAAEIFFPSIVEEEQFQASIAESLRIENNELRSQLEKVREQLEIAARESEQQKLLKDKIINSLSGRLNNPNQLSTYIDKDIKGVTHTRAQILCSSYKYAFENNEKIINEVILELSK